MLLWFINNEMKFEELIGVKDILAKHHGSDPVLFKLPETNDKILANSIFWVNTTNDLVNILNKNFGEKLEVSIKSLDQ